MDTRLIRPEDRCRNARADAAWTFADDEPVPWRSEAFAEDLAVDADAAPAAAALQGHRGLQQRRRRWSPMAALGQALAAPFLAQRPARG